MLTKEPAAEVSANMAGIVHACSFNSSNQECIVDIGATNHMTSDLGMLDHKTKLNNTVPKRVHLPNGNVTEVSHVGSYKIAIEGVIHNVLYILDFKYNLLSISKITKELQCSVLFLRDFCIF